ncbi:hypothetical protein [Lysobacter humi (ex Lee et al. 2017)]
MKDRISATVASRGPEWHAACEEFHARFDELVYPGGGAGLEAVRSANPQAVENAIRFLAADPYHFRSGYIKEYLWRWLRHVELSGHKRGRLACAALSYLERPASREFWVMANAMRQLAEPGFWVQVTNKVASGGPVGTRALILLAHAASPQTGATVRRQIRRAWLREKYSGS